jgi:hypothetical protein
VHAGARLGNTPTCYPAPTDPPSVCAQIALVAGLRPAHGPALIECSPGSWIHSRHTQPNRLVTMAQSQPALLREVR